MVIEGRRHGTATSSTTDRIINWISNCTITDTPELIQKRFENLMSQSRKQTTRKTEKQEAHIRMIEKQWQRYLN